MSPGSAVVGLACLLMRRSEIRTVALAFAPTGVLPESRPETVALLMLLPPGGAVVIAVKVIDRDSPAAMFWARFQLNNWPEMPGFAAAPVMVPPPGRVMVALLATKAQLAGKVSVRLTFVTGPL